MPQPDEIIAKLDAELLAAASTGMGKESYSTAPKLALSTRLSYACSGALGGWLFGGAIAGSTGIPFCTAAGAVAGVFRAITGRPIIDFLSDTATVPLPGQKATITVGKPGGADRMAPMPKVATNCNSVATKHCAG